MKNILTLIIILFATNCFAGGIKTELLTPIQPEIGKTYQVKIKLTNSEGKPVTLENLKEVHTKKFHLLVNTPALDDYHHIHPEPTNEAGVYQFDFTPRKSGAYRAWADITPVATNTQEYSVFDIGNAVTERVITSEAVVDGLKFTLKFDSPIKAGAATMGHVTVEKDGKPFTQLEPVMGAFGHIVAFGEDFNSILHVHPMGAEPSNPQDRGGAQLDFHLEPHSKGFIRLYVQTRVDGKDKFAEFGLVAQ